MQRASAAREKLRCCATSRNALNWRDEKSIDEYSSTIINFFELVSQVLLMLNRQCVGRLEQRRSAMKSRSWTVSILSSAVLVLVLAVGARSYQNTDPVDHGGGTSEHNEHNRRTPLILVGGILVPGNPLHFDIS